MLYLLVSSSIGGLFYLLFYSALLERMLQENYLWYAVTDAFPLLLLEVFWTAFLSD